MRNIEMITEMQEKLIEILPAAIDTLNEIINALSRAERALARLKNEK